MKKMNVAIINALTICSIKKRHSYIHFNFRGLFHNTSRLVCVRVYNGCYHCVDGVKTVTFATILPDSHCLRECKVNRNGGSMPICSLET